MDNPSSEKRLAHRYGFTEYPDYRRFDSIAKERNYYYWHRQLNILVLQVDKGFVAINKNDKRYVNEDLESVLKHWLPNKFLPC